MHRLHLTEEQHKLLKEVIEEQLEIEEDSFKDDPDTTTGKYIELLKDLQKAVLRFESV